MTLSEEQILALAPDEASRKSGKDLANPSKWVMKAVNDAALWGECQGSGSKPYQTQIDIANIAFKCSCPSRKFPCKHGLGLLLLYARQKNSFSSAGAPAWVTEWLAKRTEKQEKQEEKKDKPVDEAAQAKRQQARQLKVNDGIDELKVWLKDIVRNGILNMPEKGDTYFLNVAKRMVDAQAPGLAGMIRSLAEINFYTEGWQTKFMDQLLRIYMIAEGYGNINSLNDSLQQDIRTWIGFTQNQEELKEKDGIVDTWLVLGKQTIEEDAVTTERNWLYGIDTNSYALVLQFIIRGQGAQLTLTPGLFMQAELVFFPSLSPLRAIIRQQINTNAISTFKGWFANWNEVAQSETMLNAVLPFRSERPFVLQQLKPVNYNGQWWLQDAQQKMMQLKNDYKTIWKILAISGGEPVDMAVIGREDSYEPVGIWHNDEYKIL